MPTDHSEALDLRPGEYVRVRSATEILNTLDEDGMLDRLPFMPEMLQHCGRILSVSKRADKTCTDRSLGLRRMHDAVHLGNVRCDGVAHGGCQAACLLYWKEAWLERAEPGCSSQQTELTDPERKATEDVLVPATTNGTSPDGPGPVWRCQATEVPHATTPLRGWEWRQYEGDVRNWGLRKVIRFFLIEAFNRLQFLAGRHLPKRLLVRGGRPCPFIAGELDKGHTPSAKLDLQPGDLVRIKSREEIVNTLDKDNMTRGLTFDGEMVKFCGRTARVRARVNRLVDERNGRMIHIKSDAIILEGVTCTADYHRLCPRGIYPYWREIWLEKVDERGWSKNGAPPIRSIAKSS